MFFLLRGLFYISFTPLWEGFDEWSHYAVVQNMATGGRLLIGRDDPVSREVQASLELAPWVGAPVRNDAYWQLPDTDRAKREQRLRSIPAQWTREPAIGGATVYEAQQTPLYYWLLAPAYKLAAGLPLLTRVWLLRFFSLLVASTVIPLAFLVARRVLGDHLQALGVAALIAAMPQLMMTVGHVANDSLAVAMGSLLLFALFQWKDEPRSMPRSLALGTILGLALLTKAYFLALVAPVAVFVAIWATRKRVHKQALVLLACTVVIATWWYVCNCMLTRSFSGAVLEVAGNSSGLSLLGATRKMNWIRAIDFAFLSHIWIGNWSFLVVRSWMYHFLALFAGLAGAGLIVRLVVRRKQWPARTDLLLLLGMYLTFLAAVGYQAVRTFQSEGFAGTLGYYLFAMVVAEAILLATGLEAIAPAALAPAVIPAAVICLAALEFFGTHFYAIAYYTGFIAHLPDGSLPTLSLRQLSGGGLGTMLTRLTINKPEFLNATVLAVLWVLFLAATLGVIAVAVRLAWLRASERGT
jgi:4-amino-4-deoxy-L-arabinose transferase-like glycosyltransferase